MTYVRRSYLPSNQQRRVYGPSSRFGSEYRRVYGSTQPLPAHVEPQEPTSAPVTPAVEVAPALAAAA